MPEPIHILAVTRKPDSASYEQRVLNWIEPLAAHGVVVEPRTWPKRGPARNALLKEMKNVDAVWWHRNVVHPPTAKRVRAAAKRWVIDFDDPLSFSSKRGGRPSWTRRRRFHATVSRADAALVGSAFLAELAKPLVRRVEVAPMAVDLPDAVPVREPKHGRPVTLLWLGSASTQVYLRGLAEVFAQLDSNAPLTLRLVGGEPMGFPGSALTVDHRPWSPTEQERALRDADVGLCPMPDTLWTRGKCPYKVLQYMAWGLPWVGSAVGENLVAAGDVPNARGLAVSSTAEWVQAITHLADNNALRHRMGTHGRAYAERVHARGALTQQLVDFWRSIVSG